MSDSLHKLHGERSTRRFQVQRSKLLKNYGTNPTAVTDRRNSGKDAIRTYLPSPRRRRLFFGDLSEKMKKVREYLPGKHSAPARPVTKLPMVESEPVSEWVSGSGRSRLARFNFAICQTKPIRNPKPGAATGGESDFIKVNLT